MRILQYENFISYVRKWANLVEYDSIFESSVDPNIQKSSFDDFW